MIEEKKQITILFFGLGSIGKKHAKIIKNNYDFELFAFRTKLGQEKNNLGIQEFTNLKDAFSIKPNIAFITNPTYLHVETAIECAKRNIDLFIEKPISNTLERIDELEYEIKNRKLFTYVAYNLRFHPVIIQLKKIMPKEEKPINFDVINSSYLPDWRPKQDYTKSYSAKKDQGGGVTLDLSHEFDYIFWLFGDIIKIKGACGQISDLKIDSEDILEAKITCNPDIKGSLHLDYFNKNIQRKIMIYFNDRFVEGDLINNTIKVIDDKKNEKINNYNCDKDETYKKQIDYFFKQYNKKNYNLMNNFSEALKTFKKIMEFKITCDKIDR